MIPNAVESEVLIEAPIERVWAVVTQPEYVTQWWPQQGSLHSHVSRVEPPHVFSFKCALEPDQQPRPGNSTQIEFTLRAEGEATRLRVAESGFRNLDVREAEKAEYVAGARAAWQERLAGIPDCVAQATGAQVIFTSP
jgi:uncharacterized protein YndB with AHSA1/START domain